MAKDEGESKPSLRERAERILEGGSKSLQDLSPDELASLFYELQVHQIELKVQNEELRSAQEELERSRNKYVGLFDFAPVGYLTLDGTGLIVEANFKAGALLGLPRSYLLRRNFRDFVDSSYWIALAGHLREVREEGEWRTSELELLRRDGSHFTAHLETIRVDEGVDEDAFEFRIAFVDITDGKKAEETLRASEKRYRRLVELSPEAIYVNRNNRIELLNSAALRLFGATSADQILGKSPFDLFHPDFHPIVRDSIQALLEGRSVPLVEERIVRLDGTVRDVEIAAAFFDDQDGRAIQVMARDITGRKRAEKALRESQQMLQSVLDTIPARVFWKDLDLNYLGCNRPFARDAGLESPKEIIGRNDFDMGWAEQAELYRSDDRLVMETGSPKLGYEEPATVAGDTAWMRTNKVPLLDAEGKIRGVLGTYEDITQSKRMEELLRVSETKYRIVADNTYDWEYWKNPEGRFLYTSPSCQRITGYTASEFETDPELLFRIVHADDLAQFKAHEERDHTASPADTEFRIIHRNGTTRWIGHLCQPVFNAQGLFLGRRGSNRDITNRKQTEKALEESSQKLKLFAYSVAHDLKSPAVGLYGLTKRLRKYARDVLDEKATNYCDQILKASEHIAALVDKVNTYIATKEAPLSIERISIAEILRMLKDEFAVQLSIRQIDWLQPETVVEIKADRLSMLRAFRNLVDNSLKYGGERLSTIWTDYEESADSHIFAFSDNGKGLKEEVSERIFGAFQRNETSKGVEGAGLGLTIVKEIAEQHGGTVWVEPRSKKGITFYLSISKNV
jgi:PAS domain S-box-containing protein